MVIGATSVAARERADLYATRALVIALLRHLAQADPHTHIVSAIRNAAKRRILKSVQDGVIVSEEMVRESFAAILEEAAKL